MLARERDKKGVDMAKIRCEICGLSFATEIEKQKHLELEHMKGKKPAGVR